MNIGFQQVRFRCLWVASGSILRLHLRLWKLRRALRSRFGSDWLVAHGTELNHVCLLEADRALLEKACKPAKTSAFMLERQHLESILSSLTPLTFPAYLIETSAGQAFATRKMYQLSKQLGLRGLIFVPSAGIEGANNLATQVKRYLEAYLGYGSERSAVNQTSRSHADRRWAFAYDLDAQVIVSEYEFQSLRYFALPMALLAAPA